MKTKITLILFVFLSLNVNAQIVIWDGATSTDFGTQAVNAGESESNPILISTPQQLRYLASLVANTTTATADAWKGLCYKMTADFDLNNLSFSAGRIGIAAGNTGTYNTSTSSRPFTGVFDGDGHTISNMNMVIAGSFVALFPYLSGATVKNLNLSNGNVSGINQVGGLFAIADNSTISNCYSGCDVTSTGTIIGGLAACAFGTTTVTNCYNTGRIYPTSTSTNMVGGLIGQSGKTDGTSSVTITNCYNKGTVVGVNGNIGGLIGYSDNLIMSDCYNIADSVIMTPSVTTNNYMGGLIGRMKRNATVNTCFNVGIVFSSGDATMSNFLGGLFGSSEIISSSVITVNDCYNAGSLLTITGTSKYMAGISPVANTVTFNRCINYGAIFSGGITTPASVGGMSTNITNSVYNDCYYDSNLITTPTNSTGTAIATDDITNGTLPTNFSAAIWNGTDGFYPALVDLASTNGSIVSISPITFANGDNYSSVSSNLTLQNENSVVWSSSNTNYLTVSGSTATPILQPQKNTVYLTATLNGIKKVIPVTLEIGVTTELTSVKTDESIKVCSLGDKRIQISIIDNNDITDSYILRFYSIQGQLLKKINATEKQIEVDMSKYPSNLVILNVSKGGKLFSEKLFLR